MITKSSLITRSVSQIWRHSSRCQPQRPRSLAKFQNWLFCLPWFVFFLLATSTLQNPDLNMSFCCHLVVTLLKNISLSDNCYSPKTGSVGQLNIGCFSKECFGFVDFVVALQGSFFPACFVAYVPITTSPQANQSRASQSKLASALLSSPIARMLWRLSRAGMPVDNLVVGSSTAKNKAELGIKIRQLLIQEQKNKANNADKTNCPRQAHVLKKRREAGRRSTKRHTMQEHYSRSLSLSRSLTPTLGLLLIPFRMHFCFDRFSAKRWCSYLVASFACLLCRESYWTSLISPYCCHRSLLAIADRQESSWLWLCALCLSLSHCRRSPVTVALLPFVVPKR